MTAILLQMAVCGALGGCSDPIVAPSKLPAIQASVAAPSDSACRVLDVALSGNLKVPPVVGFPDRATCGAGLTLIKGGSATYTPKNDHEVNMLVRILNRTSGPVVLPVRVILSPQAIQIIGSGTPSNVTAIGPDSVLVGGSVLWRIGAADGLLQAGDSTVAKTLTIRFVKPATRAKLALAFDGIAVDLVPAVPPDSVPGWFGDDSSFAESGRGFLRGVLDVSFKPGTTTSAKQEAVDSVSGTVVGGVVGDSAWEGAYYVRVTDDGSGTQLRAAAAKLRSLPQVLSASLTYRIRFQSRRPRDGTDWAASDWTLMPDQATGANWALEDISAPMAWGCETGSSVPRIWVLDHGFYDVADLTPNVAQPPLAGFLAPSSTEGDHGTRVASILAARGDNAIGMTGVMWTAGLRIRAIPRLVTGLSLFPADVVKELRAISQAGADIVNLSLGVLGSANQAQAEADGRAWAEANAPRLTDLRDSGKLPLIVVAAGNEGFDASAEGIPALNPYFPNNVIVVGGSSKPAFGVRVATSLSNGGPLVDVYAPGIEVATLTRAGQVVFLGSTSASFSAPLVSGVAGLLKSFDSTLTPGQIKQFIVNGAAAAAKPVTLETGKFVLDAYASLKLAAHRPGVRNVPLCGNRLFVNATGGLVVERSGPSDLETIWPSGVSAGSWDLVTYHGGRRVGVYLTNTGGDGTRDLVLNNSAWTAIPPPATEPDPASGTWYSGISMTHDGDSTAILQSEEVPCIRSGPNASRSYCFARSGTYHDTVSLGIAPAPGRILGQKPRVVTGASGWNPIRQFLPDSGDWQTVDSVPSNASSIGSGNAYPSASSDRVYFVINRSAGTVESLGNWGSCSEGAATPTCRKRDFLWHSRTLSASVYAVPWPGGSIDSLWSVRDSVINEFRTSEDGRELALTTLRVEQVRWLTYDYFVEGPLVSYTGGTGLSYVSPLTGALIRSFTNLGPYAFGTMSSVKGTLSASTPRRGPRAGGIVGPLDWPKLLSRPGITPRK
jgi:hypothetical protein